MGEAIELHMLLDSDSPLTQIVKESPGLKIITWAEARPYADTHQWSSRLGRWLAITDHYLRVMGAEKIVFIRPIPTPPKTVEVLVDDLDHLWTQAAIGRPVKSATANRITDALKATRKADDA